MRPQLRCGHLTQTLCLKPVGEIMVNFTKNRLQVFVSSTFTDLSKERQSAVGAILTAGHIPAGMELFTSGDESQMEVIKQWIDESDVYLLILGGRYGSVEPTSGKSYTQLEYEYAISKDKPLFSCVATEEALEERVKQYGSSVLETDNPKKLKEFRAEVLTKMVKFWSDEKDIKIAIGETMSHFSRREELSGWVRAEEEVNMPALADEIARLSKENANLRERITSQSSISALGPLTYEELKQLLIKRSVIDLFINLRPELDEWLRVTYETEEKFRLLRQYGLVAIDDENDVMITSMGRDFYARYDYERMIESE